MKGYNVDEIEFEDDSNLTTPELLTGEYLTSIGKNIQPNAEVEGGEYVQFPDKETQKVAGKDHEQGGVPVNIPDGTKVLSKSLNLSKQQAKMLKDVFDIELTTKDNYAAALDKYTKKIGLKKLNDEQEEVFKSLEKTLDKTKDQKTLRLNKAFISEKIQEIGNKKEPLEKQRAQFFDTLFELQEKSKADKGDEDAMFRYGGIQKAKFDAIATKLGLDPEQAAIMLKAKREGTIPSFKPGGTQGGDPKKKYTFPTATDAFGNPIVVSDYDPLKDVETIQKSRPGSGYGEKVQNVSKFMDVHSWYFGKMSEKEKEAFIKEATAGKKSAKIEDFQNAYNKVLKEEAKKRGMDDKKINEIIEEIGFSNKGVQQLDGKFGAFTSSRPFFDFSQPPAPATTTPPPGETVTPPPTGDPKPKGTGTRIEDGVTTTPNPQYPRAFFMPDQSVMPPTPPVGHLKANIRLDRIDPLRIGIDQTIQDTADQRNFVTDQLNSLPESQRAAITANLLANSQKTVSDAATKANMVNAQNYSQAELFNIQQRGQEQMFGAQNALDFERRQFTANAKYDESLRNYFDYNRKVNTTNFQNQQKLNLIDSLFPDYDLDYMGASVSYNPKSEWQPVVTGQNKIQVQNITPQQYPNSVFPSITSSNQNIVQNEPQIPTQPPQQNESQTTNNSTADRIIPISDLVTEEATPTENINIEEQNNDTTQRVDNMYTGAYGSQKEEFCFPDGTCFSTSPRETDLHNQTMMYLANQGIELNENTSQEEIDNIVKGLMSKGYKPLSSQAMKDVDTEAWAKDYLSFIKDYPQYLDKDYLQKHFTLAGQIYSKPSDYGASLAEYWNVKGVNPENKAGFSHIELNKGTLSLFPKEKLNKRGVFKVKKVTRNK